MLISLKLVSQKKKKKSNKKHACLSLTYTTLTGKIVIASVHTNTIQITTIKTCNGYLKCSFYSKICFECFKNKEAYSGHYQTSTMNFFAKIVNGFNVNYFCNKFNHKCLTVPQRTSGIRFVLVSLRITEHKTIVSNFYGFVCKTRISHLSSSKNDNYQRLKSATKHSWNFLIIKTIKEEKKFAANFNSDALIIAFMTKFHEM